MSKSIFTNYCFVWLNNYSHCIRYKFGSLIKQISFNIMFSYYRDIEEP